MHAGLAEEAHSGTAGAQQHQFHIRRQLRHQFGEQVFALAAVDAAQHQHAQKIALRHRARRHRRWPVRQSVRDHVPWQRGQARFDALDVVAHAVAGCDQYRVGGQQRRDMGVAQRLPGFGAGFTEGRVGIGPGQIGGHRLYREIPVPITEIDVQRRPQRVVVVADQRGGQAGAQRTQAMPDQRGHQYPRNTVARQHVPERGVVFVRGQRGGLDAQRQRPAQQRCGAQVVVQFQHFARAAVRRRAACDQCQMAVAGVGAHQVFDETLHAAAPAVQQMQHHRHVIAPGGDRNAAFQCGQTRVLGQQGGVRSQFRCVHDP